MATLRLEDIWRHDVMAQGWSSRAAAQLSFSLAPSTLLTYNRVLNKLKQFCLERGVPYPPVSSATVADFLCFLADDSARPRSVLVTAQAALGHLYTGLHLPNVIKCPVIVRLSDALVKSGTTSLMLPSRVMPTQDFKDLFCGWPDNDRLELQNLRLKAITLLALLLMLRPSDIAPRAELFDSATTTSHRVIFSTDQLVFNDDGSLTVQFFGIKNDSTRSGFVVTIPAHSDKKLDPVLALRVYLDRTASQRLSSGTGAAFLTLHPPYRAIQSSTVGSILSKAIALAGLGGRGFSPKSFRPTGATMAVDGGISPHIVQQIGRWKCTDVFFKHYVHSQTPSGFSDSLL